MKLIFQIVALTLGTSVFCLMLRMQHSVTAVLLSLCVSIGILLVALEFLQPILEVLEELRNLSGLAPSVTAPMLKIVAIGFLSQICCAVCSDVGEIALQKAVEFSCTILVLYTALPLLTAVLKLVKEILNYNS